MLKPLLCATALSGALAFSQSPIESVTGAPAFLHLRYASFDPVAGLPEVPAELRSPADSRLFIAQFVGTPTQEGRDAVVRNGGEVIGYLPDDAYVVRLDSSRTESLEREPMVRSVSPYHTAYRLDPALVAAQQYLDGEPVRYNVVVANKRTDKPALMQRVTALGGQVDHDHGGGLLIEVTLTGEQLLAVAGLDEVLWMDRWTAPELDMDNARIQGGGNHVEAQGGYTGAGVNAHIYEGLEPNHPDFTGGVQNVRSGGEPQSHGHATAGCVFGNGTSNPAVRGMAPDAGKFFTTYTSVIGSRYQVFDDLVNIHNVSHSTASWGDQRTFFYTAISADSDDAVFDHDIAWTQSQSNAGNQDSRPQAWAKNVFSIGAVDHFNNADPNDDSWEEGNASTGPASDGRIKPTLCAYYDAIGTSDRVGGNGYSNGDWTSGFGGTSGATPIVAGHNVLAIQMFTDELNPGFGAFGNPLRVPGGTSHENRPHFPTLKALQVVSATQYAFTGASSDNRREHQGWGFPDLETMWEKRDRTFVIDETDVLTQGQTSVWSVDVMNGEPSLKVCLNWSEPAGNPAASSHLVNDLSLRVHSPTGQSYWGNHNLENGVWSTTGGSEDHVNSLECVFVENPAAGEWLIEVIATAVVQDNHVETPITDIDYGLVSAGGFAGSLIPVCIGLPNSTAVPAALELSGSFAVADNDFTITVVQLPNDSLGYALTSMDTTLVTNPGGSAGNLCIAGSTIARFAGTVLNSGASGQVSFQPDLTAFPTSTSATEMVLAGETRYFQYWYRDAFLGFPVSNFSGAVGVEFE